jgi:hypothetical protein
MDIINDPYVGGLSIDALPDWISRYCRVAANRAGFTLLLAYKTEEDDDGKQTVIYRVHSK